MTGHPFGRELLDQERRGGSVTTTSDLALFFQTLVRGELLSDDMMAEMTETVPMGTELSAGHGLIRVHLSCGWRTETAAMSPTTHQVLVSPDRSKVVVPARGGGDWFTAKPLAEKIYCQAVSDWSTLAAGTVRAGTGRTPRR